MLHNPRFSSRQNRPHDLAGHVGQAEVAALKTERHALVVNAQKVQHGGVEVMDADRVFHDVVGVIIAIHSEKHRG